MASATTSAAKVESPKSAATSATAEPALASASAAPPADFDAIPWENEAIVGAGAARKDTRNPLGENVFLAYAGWHVSLEAAKAWAAELYRTSLRARGVRWVYAVRGPKDPMYKGHEIGTKTIASSLIDAVTPATKFVLVVAHSSGAFVANEILAELAHGGDPADETRERIVYFNLEGGSIGLDDEIVDRLRRVYFVGAIDPLIGTVSPSDDEMRAAAAQWPQAGGYMQHVANGSGCRRGATWCVHMTLVTTKPHDPGDAKEIDFADFHGRSVEHGYLEEKAKDAQIDP